MPVIPAIRRLSMGIEHNLSQCSKYRTAKDTERFHLENKSIIKFLTQEETRGWLPGNAHPGCLHPSHGEMGQWLELFQQYHHQGKFTGRLVELFLWRTWPTLRSPGSMPIYTTVPAYINHRKGPYTILATLPTRPS